MPVEVKFLLCLADGTVVDRTEMDETMLFVPGDGQWIENIEHRILDLAVGEQQTWLLSPDEAFGYPDPSQQHWVSLTDLEDIEPIVGQVIEFNLPNGDAVAATVLSVEETRALLDFSHPLAGRELILEVERLA